MTRLLHFGDLHLGKRGTHERTPGDGLNDQRELLERVVEIAREENVDAIVCGGDIFEGPAERIVPEQYALVQRAFAPIAREMPVITITGNGRHDAARRAVKAPEVLRGTLEVYTRPDIRVIGDTALCLLPWVDAGRIRAEWDGGDSDDVDATVAQLLLRAARDLHLSEGYSYGAPIKHRVLVFHGKIEGAALPTGLSIDDVASDVLPVDELAAIGFDAIVASDIHVPQAWHDLIGWTRSIAPECPTPPIVYTGSPMPLDFGEANYEHGVWLLDLAEDVRATFLPIDGRRFVTVDVDLTADTVEAITGLDDTDAIATAIADRFPLAGDIVRVRVRATDQQASRIDAAALARLLDDADVHKHYVRVETIRGQRARVEVGDEEIQPLDALNLYIDAHGLDDADANALRERTSMYLDRLGVSA